MTNQELIEVAKKAMEKAYAPYSKFSVGAALLTTEGKVFTGCNIENASFGATNCAERTAMFKAVSEGYRCFTKIAIVSNAGVFTYPCGICRQVMTEFMKDGEIILHNKQDEVEVIKVADMMPYRFEL